MAKSYQTERPDIPVLRQTDYALPDGAKPHSGHGTQASFSTTRHAQHRGRKISVRTTYRIEIDGEPLRLHTTVLDDGTVHCHGLPNYAFASAVDMARQIIDASMLAHEERDDLGDGDGHGHGHGGTHQ